MKNILLFFILSLSFFTQSCSKDDVTTTAPVEAKVIVNSAYGADPLQKMDIYLPADRSSTQTISLLMIHGGGWYAGDKVDLNAYIDTIKKRFPSYAIFNLNYRLSASPLNLFPTQEMDVLLAVNYFYEHRAEYIVSDKFILLGASAGAHLAMLQAYKYATPAKPKAVVSFFGPSDLTEMYYNPAQGNTSLSSALAQVVGATPMDNPTLYIQSSPVTFISNLTAMPTILLHGGSDPLVNASQSETVHNLLDAAGIPNQYVFYPFKGHGDWDNATFEDAFNKVEAFLSANVH